MRTYEQFVRTVERYPHKISRISFDHDLGTVQDGHDCFNWLEEQIFTGKVTCPDFMQTHSMNPGGKQQLQQAIIAVMRREMDK